jgi:hypothetical protein
LPEFPLNEVAQKVESKDWIENAAPVPSVRVIVAPPVIASQSVPLFAKPPPSTPGFAESMKSPNTICRLKPLIDCVVPLAGVPAPGTAIPSMSMTVAFAEAAPRTKTVPRANAVALKPIPSMSLPSFRRYFIPIGCMRTHADWRSSNLRAQIINCLFSDAWAPGGYCARGIRK